MSISSINRTRYLVDRSTNRLRLFTDTSLSKDLEKGIGPVTYPTLSEGRVIPVRDGSSSTLVDWSAPANAKCFAGYQPVYNQIPQSKKTCSLWTKFGPSFITNNPDGSVSVNTTASDRAFIYTTLTFDKIGQYVLTFNVTDIDPSSDLTQGFVLVNSATATYTVISGCSVNSTEDQRIAFIFDVTAVGNMAFWCGIGSSSSRTGIYTISKPFLQDLTSFTSKIPGVYVDPDFNNFGAPGLNWLSEQNENILISGNKITEASSAIPESELYGYYAAEDGEHIKIPIINLPSSEGVLYFDLTIFYDTSTTTSDKAILGDASQPRGLLFDSSDLNILGTYDGFSNPPAELSIYDQSIKSCRIRYSLDLNTLYFKINNNETVPSQFTQTFPNDGTHLHILCSGGMAIKNLIIWDKEYV